jgi:hypothetical protein
MAKQFPAAGHETDVSCSNVPVESEGARARFAVQLPPEKVSITVRKFDDVSRYRPMATHEPCDGHDTSVMAAFALESSAPRRKRGDGGAPPATFEDFENGMRQIRFALIAAGRSAEDSGGTRLARQGHAVPGDRVRVRGNRRLRWGPARRRRRGGRRNGCPGGQCAPRADQDRAGGHSQRSTRSPSAYSRRVVARLQVGRPRRIPPSRFCRRIDRRI